jgi:hypothetical protein
MRLNKFIAAATVASFAFAGTFSATTAKEATPPPDGVAKAQLAATLAQYGEANHDPASLLAAAHIINGLKSNVAMKTPMKDGAGQPESYDPLTLLKLAKTYATGPNASLAAAIDTEMKAVSATQAVCYYQYYCNGWGYCWYQYYCY